MADVSNDAIKLLDRGEFSNAVDVQEKRLTRNIRIASVSSAVFWIIWLIVTGIFHGEICRSITRCFFSFSRHFYSLPF